MLALQRKLGRLLLGRRWSGGFRRRHERSERRGILHGDIREYFAVERDARSLEAVNQLAVRQAVLAGGSAHALNPQAAILALLDAAGALGIAIGAIGRFLCGLVELALGEGKSFFPLEVLLAPCPALGAAFYACHGFFLLGGKQNGLRRREEKHASHNGFVSRYELLGRVQGSPFGEQLIFAAHRPAGTREALPGAILRSFRSAFSFYWHDSRHAIVAKKFFTRTAASA